MNCLASIIIWTLLFVAQAGAATVADSRAPQTIEAPAQRVVALSWALAEMVLELDETPLAVADVEGYRTWVERPFLPETVKDVGLRREPNFERIAELKPDLILAGDDQIDLVGRLEEIAPVLYFDAFSEDHDNYAVARESYVEISKALGKENFAKQQLARLDEELGVLKKRLAAHFGGDLPKVTPIQFMDEATLRVHAANSMAQYALEALGLEHGFPQPPSAWGFALKKVEDLAAVEEGLVLHIEPFPDGDKLFGQPLWQFMPFVKEGRFGAIRPTWTFGGPFSVGYLAEGIAETLLDLGP
jgi:iron complex transport system substrate-binding protein